MTTPKPPIQPDPDLSREPGREQREDHLRQQRGERPLRQPAIVVIPPRRADIPEGR